MEKILNYLIDKEKSLIEKFKFTGDFKLLQILNNDKTIGHNEKYSFDESLDVKIQFGKAHKRQFSESLAYDIVNNWGGISGFKQNDKNNEKLRKFITKLSVNDKYNLTRKEFNTISSLSKVAFFYDIENFCIYDSRVIYALNWIIFVTGSESKFFPMPNGRNNIIVNYPIDSLIHFSLLYQDKSIESEFHTYKEAYFQYNQLMKALTKALSKNHKYPFYTEMLLFGMIDEDLINEIKRSIEVKIIEK